MSKHTHNRAFFDVLTPLSCYWAGFIAADGSIYAPNGNIRIGLSEKDKQQIELFKSAIKSSSPVRCFDTSNGYRCAQIDVYGAYECQQVLQKTFNITQAKSKTLRPPLLENEKDVRHFIRGYMDGDGSISFNQSSKSPHWTVSFVGTQEMLQWIKQQIQLYVIGVGNPSVCADRNIFQILFGGWQVRPILDWLYQDSTPQIRLARKHQKYLEVLNFYSAEKRKYVSRYRGVDFFKRTGKWKAEIKKNNQRYHLGYFATEREAALAYNDKARELGLLERCYSVS
jgi:hypothetical protein